MDVKKAINLIRRGVDIKVLGNKIYKANELNWNQGFLMQAIVWNGMTNKDIADEIRSYKYMSSQD